MAFSNSTSERMDELRFRSHRSSQGENTLLGLVSPPRNGNRLPPPTSENRGFTLTRRFTTDSGRVPTLSSIAGSRVEEDREYTPSTYHKVQLLEKKKLEYERLREQKRRFEAEMQILDLQQRQEEQELRMMQEDLGRHNGNTNLAGGHQSEPTTPPEYSSHRETSSGFPTVLSRPNRYSTSSLTSPLGQLYNRPGRSASTLTPGQFGMLPSRFTMDENVIMKSGSGSRRGSDEEDDEEQAVRQDPSSHRSSDRQNTHRYSMPVTKSRNGIQDMLALDKTNTARFLFGDEENNGSSQDRQDPKSYLHQTEDGFPILLRGEHPQQKTTASSAALDLASNQQSNDSSGWTSFTPRHRQNQQSLPSNTMSSAVVQNGHSPAAMNGNGTSTPGEPAGIRSPSRYSQDMKYYSNGNKAEPLNSSNGQNPLSPPKLQSSYSANDVPTMKSADINATPKSHAQQHFHNHQASLGRIPVGAYKRENSGQVSSPAETPNSGSTATTGYSPGGSMLQASVPPFNPSNTQTAMHHQQPSQQQQQPVASSYNPYSQQNPYYPYGAPMMGMTMAMQGMNMGGPQGYNHGYGDPYQYGQQGQMMPRDSQARVIQQRRQTTDGEAMNRFANVTLESLTGEIYTLCKDQHGCRFLQKQLESRDEGHIHIIWEETNQHVIELMTDPFGNYLCQKLLEYCNDVERTGLIQNASHDLVRIALNQHGTRALQKMIEYISTREQVQIIVESLRNQVVELIQDLNGNHVIQKCLNKLSSKDAQFIFDAVGIHCVDVGTHRHGCCVLQRCIDHASGEQKAWLIRQISNSAFVLVQDPFGNYVVQYILDLNEPVFTEPLVHMFKGKVGQLSRQKFSSNVIEKCLRCAQEEGRNMLIDEMLSSQTELERLLRDSYANYVIQTAIDYATGPMKQRLIDAIRPILPSIRGTPYGRRIQAKIQGIDSRLGSGETTPVAGIGENGQLPLRVQQHQRTLSNASAVDYNANVAAFNPEAYGQGTGTAGGNGMQQGRPPVTTFPSSGQIATHGLAAHPGFMQAYEGLGKQRGGRGAGGNYF